MSEPVTTSTAELSSAPLATRPLGPGNQHWRRRALSNGRIRLGLVIVTAVCLLTVLGPLLAPHGVTDYVGKPFSDPSGVAPLGTDVLGRDVLSRFLAGGRSLLVISLLGTVIGVVVGGLIGVLVAYLGGWRDAIVSRVADALLAFPALILALLALSLLGSAAWLLVTIVAIGHIPRTLRVVRGATLTVVERDFVLYQKMMAASANQIVRRELLPNVFGTLMVEMGLRFTFSIGLVASLGFLGLGVQPPDQDWGTMINENRSALTSQPWGVIPPLLGLAVLVIGANLITDGLSRVVGAIDDADR
jgi:peptide/nickel transport system permease protein